MSNHSLIKNVIPISSIRWMLLMAFLLLTTGCGGGGGGDVLLGDINAKLSIAPCPENATVVKFDYLGACGLTDASNFTLNTAADVSRIRIWYNTNIGGNSLNVNITGPNEYSWSGPTEKGNCDTFQKNWCEGIVTLDQRLAAGTYTVAIGSTSMCANPSGQTTLIVYGCEAVLFPPYDFRYTLTGGQLTLQWDSSLGAEGYRLFWGTESGNYPASADLGNTGQLGPFSVGDFPKTVYYLAVEAYNKAGSSIPSNELVIDLNSAGSLAAPKTLNYTLTGDMFTLNWDSVANSVGYKLYLGSQPGQYTSFYDLGANQQLGPIDVSSLPRGNYYLAVTAYDAKQESLYSKEILIALRTTGGTGDTEVGGYIDSVLALSNDVLNGGLTEQLQPILSAVLGKPTSTCPTVKMNADLSSATDIDSLLANLPKPTIVNIDYGQGCKVENGDTFSGSAEVKLDNLTIDSVSKTLTATLNIVANNLTKNGKVLSDGSAAGTFNANLGNSTGDGHLELSNFLVSTGKRLTGKVDLSVIDTTNTGVNLDIFIDNGVHAQLALLATKINDNSYSISTKNPGSVNQYTVVLKSIVYDTQVCKAYPISGSADFTADGKTQTATFDNRCDGTYTLQ